MPSQPDNPFSHPDKLKRMSKSVPAFLQDEASLSFVTSEELEPNRWICYAKVGVFVQWWQRPRRSAGMTPAFPINRGSVVNPEEQGKAPLI